MRIQIVRPIEDVERRRGDRYCLGYAVAVNRVQYDEPTKLYVQLSCTAMSTT